MAVVALPIIGDMKKIGLLALFLGLTQSGCIMAGYSSRGGWFLWPGGLGLVVIVVLWMLLSRGR